MEFTREHLEGLLSHDFGGERRCCTEASKAAVMGLAEYVAGIGCADEVEEIGELVNYGKEECRHCVKVWRNEVGRLFWWIKVELPKGL